MNEQLTTADFVAATNREQQYRGDDEFREQEQNFGGAGAGRARAEEDFNGPLLPEDFSRDMKTRWDSIQGSFIDDPRSAVQHADELVASAIKKLAESFASEREGLEHQWAQGGDASTEDLRLALRKYRAFFQRLLSI